jgi:hypothetical protein
MTCRKNGCDGSDVRKGLDARKGTKELKDKACHAGRKDVMSRCMEGSAGT